MNNLRKPMFLFGLLVLPSLMLLGQSYGDFPKSRKKIVIDENFNNGMTLQYFVAGSMGTSSSEAATLGSGPNGMIKSTKILLTSVPNAIPMDINDFELEIIAKHEMTARSTFRLTLRPGDNASNNRDWITFNHINHNISLGYYKSGPDRTSSLGSSKSKEIVRDNDFNKYTIRKVQNIYYVFINEIFAISLESNNFMPAKIEFLVNDTNAELDQITLYQLVAPGEGTTDSAEFLSFD